MSISNGQQTLRTAGHYLGGHEGAPNRSGAPVIDQCQKFYGVGPGVPWCACWVGYVIDQSDADAKYKAAAKSICHPSTQVMADRAKAKGWLLPGNGQAKPGDLLLAGSCGRGDQGRPRPLLALSARPATPWRPIDPT